MWDSLPTSLTLLRVVVRPSVVMRPRWGGVDISCKMTYMILVPDSKKNTYTRSLWFKLWVKTSNFIIITFLPYIITNITSNKYMYISVVHSAAGHHMENHYT